MTSTEVAKRPTSTVDPGTAARMSKSKLVPEHIANDAASAEYMMRIGASLGIDPVSAFQHIFIFPDGKGRLKAGMSAHLMHALAIAAGHEVHVEGGPLQATAVLIRRTDQEKLSRFQAMREEERRGKLALLEDTQRLYEMERRQLRETIADLKELAELDEASREEIEAQVKELRQKVSGLTQKYDFDKLREDITSTKFDLAKLTRFESTWTKSRAAQIGLADKDVWQNFGPEMLKSRAKSSVVRDGAIDVILGIKRIFSDLGLEFANESVDDELAASSVVYTVEEMGAEVDGDGRPIKGRVVNVTAAGVSKTQDRLVRAAEELISGKAAAEIKSLVDLTTGSDKDSAEKIDRLDAMAKAVDKTKQGDEEVSLGDETLPLSAYIQAAIKAIQTIA